MQLKDHIRQTIKQKRLALSSNEVQRRSRSVFQRLMKSNFYQNAQSIACYVSVQNEVDTHNLIQIALKNGKQIGVPVTDPDGHMAFQAISSLDILHPVHFGLLEPPRDANTEIPPESFDLILLPGLAFDDRGNRIGSGGGYFDRFLSTIPAHTAALSYDFQILDQIPTDSHDIRLDYIITESRVITCK